MVGQKFHLGFPVISYGKPNELFGQPNNFCLFLHYMHKKKSLANILIGDIKCFPLSLGKKKKKPAFSVFVNHHHYIRGFG